MAMTVDEAANILKCMYRNAPDGKKALSVHIFGIKYADELAELSVNEVATRAEIPGYAAEINKGRNLAEYVKITKCVDW